MVRSGWFAVVAVGLGACGGDSDKGSTGDRVDAILALEGDVGSGATLFDTNCTICHGADGSGGSGNDLRPVDDETEIVETVLFGVDGTAMSGFEDQLEDQDIADITAFVLTL